jgi:hypothetical protein
MNKILYQSLYSDPDFTGLKHSIFYFDSIDIPNLNVPIFWGENNENIRYLQTIPEKVRGDIEYLKKAGVVNIVGIEGNKHWENIRKTSEIIIHELDLKRERRLYEPVEIFEICNFLKINEKDPELLTNVGQVSIFLASACITSLSFLGQICCIDNKVIFDSINSGINGIIKSKLPSNDIDAHQINKWKANLLAQKVISLNLPSFEFYSFDDVFDLKMKFRENLLALHNHLADISKNIDGMPWESNFENKIIDYINKKIQPDIADLIKNVKTSPRKIANKIYDSALFNLPLSFTFYGIFAKTLKELLIETSATIILDAIRSAHQEAKNCEANSPYSIFLKVRKT